MPRIPAWDLDLPFCNDKTHKNKQKRIVVPSWYSKIRIIFLKCTFRAYFFETRTHE